MNADFPTALVHGLRPDLLIEVARQIVPDGFSLEVLLFVGSLAEGLGSATSDIDLIMLVVGTGELPMDEIALEVDGVIVDVQLQSLPEAARKLAACGDWASKDGAQGGERALATAPFSEGERTFLHRLLSGKFLLGSPDRLALIAVREAALRSLLRLKFDAARHYARARQVDAHGCFVDGDVALAAAMAHDALHHAVDALTAALGESNVNPKWRLRLLRRLEREGRISPAVGETIARLLMGGVDPADDAACAAFAARAAAAVRALLVGATIVMDLDLPLRLCVRSDDPSPASDGHRLRLDLDCHVSRSSTRLRLLSGDKPPYETSCEAVETVFLSDPDAPLVIQRNAGSDGADRPKLDLTAWLAHNAATSTIRPLQ